MPNPAVEERYVRELVSNPAIGGRQSTWPIDILSLVDVCGSTRGKENRLISIYHINEEGVIMNFTDTLASVELVLVANQVPLFVGETGIGKTSLARA